MKRTGRPPFKITKPVCAKVQRLASQGLNKKQIAQKLVIGYSTLLDKQATSCDFRQALEAGWQDYIETKPVTGNALFDEAMSGDVWAMIRFLCARNPGCWSFDGLHERRRMMKQIEWEERNPEAVMVDRPVLVLEPSQVKIGLYVVLTPRGLVVVKCSKACQLGNWKA